MTGGRLFRTINDIDQVKVDLLISIRCIHTYSEMRISIGYILLQVLQPVHFSASPTIGDRWGLGTAYRGLGLVEQEQGRHDEAIEVFQKSRSILNDLGARWVEARVLGDMGRSIFALGKITDAENTWRMSIQIASEVMGTSLVLESILGIANVRAKQGNYELAYELVLVVLNHPATIQETRGRAAKLSAELEKRLTMQEVNSIQARIEERDFDALIMVVLTRLIGLNSQNSSQNSPKH